MVIKRRASKQSPRKQTATKRGSKKPSVGTQNPDLLPKLTETEQDLLWHMEHGYRLKTDSLGGDPVLRKLNDDKVVRPASANRTTLKALEERGLIAPAKDQDLLKIVWQVKKRGQ